MFKQYQAQWARWARLCSRDAAALFVALTCLSPILVGCGDSKNKRSSSEVVAEQGSIRVLSNRSDLISGGDALVEILLPEGGDAREVRVRLNGGDVTRDFAQRENGRYMGLVNGLHLGKNSLSAVLPGGLRAQTTLINHPQGGPLFSGPQIQPWLCQEGAIDAQCNQPPVYSWLYRSNSPLPSELKPYDPKNPASDVASTTTDQGVKVPFIVRVETGYQNRDQYRIAVLYQPGQPWAPWSPQPQWNRKLLVTHGGNVGAAHGAGTAPTQDYSGTFPAVIPGLQTLTGDSQSVALGRGFAVMSTALNNNGHNVNVVTQAESMVMAKERLVEAYGELRYTIGTGCSGGAIASQQMANAYPGIYQGLIVQCSFPDSWTTAVQVGDYHLLRRYFEQPQMWAPGIVWNPLQWAAVEGDLLPLGAIIADTSFFPSISPTSACHGVSDAQRYNPKSNPGGTRCGLADYMENVFGLRSPAVWGDTERQIGRGFTGIPLDNIGVQYGLASLQQGLISADMFLDLNEKIGGFDIDINTTPERLKADLPALANAYRSGAINDASNLDQVAIIDLRGPDPGIAHPAFHSWAMRSRIERVHGHANNHVIWFGPVPLMGDLTYTTDALLAMDRWLTKVEADHRKIPLAQKIVSGRPQDIQDRCTSLSGLGGADGVSIPLLGNVLNEPLAPLLNLLNPILTPVQNILLNPVQKELCGIGLVQALVQTRYGTPRTVAGDALTTMTNKCQLKPVDSQENYGPFPLNAGQWSRLKVIFPQGVCDYSQPPAYAQPTQTWMKYSDIDGNVIVGGEKPPIQPSNSRGGWSSSAFLN